MLNAIKSKNRKIHIRMHYLIVLIIFYMLGGFDLSYAQSIFYVRAGATGANNGADWTNAYSSLPATLQRGATYYIADGNYNSYNFDDAESGSTRIMIKKATSSDHGTSTGWSSSYGDGQAVFGGFTFDTGYYEVNGQKRNESDWEDYSAYGISVKKSGGGSGSRLINIPDNKANNITLKYLDITGESRQNPVDRAFYCVYKHANIYIGYSLFRNSAVPILTRGTSNVTLEYNYFDENLDIEGGHQEAISHQGGDDWTIRNNVFDAILDTGVIVILNSKSGGESLAANQVQHYRWNVYGNIFWFNPNDSTAAWGVGNGVFCAINKQGVNDFTFHNNTIVNYKGYNAGVRYEGNVSNSHAYNNIWYLTDKSTSPQGGATAVSISGSHDYNTFVLQNGTSAPSEAHGIKGSSDPFVDWKNGNFRLKQEMGGIALTSIPKMDMRGNIRGTDGLWDRGAIEFTGEEQSEITPPSGVRIIK
jgi:hypothetical protein